MRSALCVWPGFRAGEIGRSPTPIAINLCKLLKSLQYATATTQIDAIDSVGHPLPGEQMRGYMLSAAAYVRLRL